MDEPRAPSGMSGMGPLTGALRILNEMEVEGLFRRYAIGGAMALAYHSEPDFTQDLDIFILVSTDELIISLSPLYQWLSRRGYEAEAEHVIIEGVPVQILPAYKPLVEEAVVKAFTVTYFGVETRVPPLEYLIAIMLDTGRAKDKTRIARVLETASFDVGLLESLVTTFGLTEKWRKLQELLNE